MKYDDYKSMSSFRITFDRNKIENYGFHRWKTEDKDASNFIL